MDEADEIVGDEEPKPEASDPWRERALAAEAAQQQAMATLQQMLNQQQQQPSAQSQQTEPDFEEAASRIGITPAQLRGIVGVVGSQYAPVLEEIRASQRAAQPTFEEKLEKIIEGAGYEVDESDAVAAVYRVQKSLGQNATDKQVMRAAIADLKSRKPTEPSRRTAGLSGGSIPPGRRRAETEKPVENMCDMISKDQRKRGLYAY